MKHPIKHQIYLVFSLLLFLVPFVAAPLFDVELADESLYLTDGFRVQKYSHFRVDLGVLDQIDVSVYRLESVFLSESISFSSLFQTRSFDSTGLDLFDSVILIDLVRIIPSPLLYETLGLMSFLDYSYLRFYSVVLSTLGDIQEGFKQFVNPRFYESWSLSDGFKEYLNPFFSDLLTVFDDVVSRFILKVREAKNTSSKGDIVPRQRESLDDVEDLDVSDSVSVSVTRAYRVDLGDIIEFDDCTGGDDINGYSVGFILVGAFLLTAFLAVGINFAINKVG